MIRFMALTIFFVMVIGLLLHFEVDIPYVTPWLGELPGDLIIRKGHLTLYVPLASSALISLFLSFAESAFKK